jgi:hypothetical protein
MVCPPFLEKLLHYKDVLVVSSIVFHLIHRLFGDEDAEAADLPIFDRGTGVGFFGLEGIEGDAVVDDGDLNGARRL